MNYSRQRELIKETIRCNPVHPTADELLILARKSDPTIGLATVYRNLKQLAQNGEILRIPAEDAEHFDGNISMHFHMQCTSCRRVYDLFCDKVPDLSALTKNTCHKIVGVSILFTGICESCLKKANL